MGFFIQEPNNWFWLINIDSLNYINKPLKDESKLFVIACFSKDTIFKNFVKKVFKMTVHQLHKLVDLSKPPPCLFNELG